MCKKVFLVSAVLTVILSFGSFVRCENMYEKCGDKLQCVEKELIKYVDRLDGAKSVPVLGDFLVLEKREGEAMDLPKADEGIFERCLRYLASHELKIRAFAGSERSLVEEGRTRKLRRIILPLLLLLKLKAAIVIPAILFFIGLLAFKGLGAGLIALTVAGSTGLKSLLDSHQAGNKLSFEVVPQFASPHWSRTDPVPQLHQTP